MTRVRTRNKESITGRPNLPCKTSETFEKTDAPELGGKHLEGLMKSSNPPDKGTEHRMNRLHMEMGDVYITVAAREIDHWTPPGSDLGNNKQTAVKYGRHRGRLDSLLHPQIHHRSRKSNPPDGVGKIALKGERNLREQWKGAKGNVVAAAENLDKSSIRIPKTPRLPSKPQGNPLPCRVKDMTPTCENHSTLP